mgnify:CR=1 FL=1
MCQRQFVMHHPSKLSPRFLVGIWASEPSMLGCLSRLSNVEVSFVVGYFVHGKSPALASISDCTAASISDCTAITQSLKLAWADFMQSPHRKSTRQSMQRVIPQHSHLLKQAQLPTQTEFWHPMHRTVSQPISEHTLHVVFVIVMIFLS